MINNITISDDSKYLISLFPTNFKGVLVDIGAFHGIKLSNSFLFELWGWDTYCIEPNPNNIESLRETREHVLEYACGAENKDNIPLYVFNLNDEVGEAAGTGLLDFRVSSNGNEQLHKDIFKRTNTVKLRTLDWLMSNEIKQSHIDLLTIDVERYELEVLKGADLLRWKVKVLCIENLERPYGLHEISHEIKDTQELLLRALNYRYVHRIEYNDIYIHNDYYSELIRN